jgi:exodeoxyribonuclease VII large subunit
LNSTRSKQIYSVSELTENIKLLLERSFSMVWICGEISNSRIPSSGHLYCSLKDDQAQIAAVMFRGQLRQLKFKLEDGIGIIGLGRVSVYEPRGTYQIILEYVEPKGVGALQLSFEQLKKRLEQEGLFHVSHKRPLPHLPSTICVITSPTGAVLSDILHVANRRFPGIRIEILPVKVQGESAPAEIAHAIELANIHGHADVLIIARGGGSLEDLSAFNSEIVARSIFASTIPIVSAIGHETDVTIADFVADMRAPTPSAAAELVVPVKAELKSYCLELRQRCLTQITGIIERLRREFYQVRRSLVHPTRKVQELQLRTDDLSSRLNRAINLLVHLRKSRISNAHSNLLIYNPNGYISKNILKVILSHDKLIQSINKYAISVEMRLSSAIASLDALSPLAVLRRGYSIVRTLPDKRVVTCAQDVQQGDALEILFSEGNLIVTVDGRVYR